MKYFLITSFGVHHFFSQSAETKHGTDIVWHLNLVDLQYVLFIPLKSQYKNNAIPSFGFC